MDLQTIRNESRRLLNVPAGSNLIPDAELTSWANFWMRDLCAYLEWPMISGVATTVSGQRTYTLPSDFLKLQEVHFKQDGGDFKRLPIVTRNDLATLQGKGWFSDANGKPVRVYMADNAVLGLHPPPDATNAGSGYLRIFYIGVPTAMSSDADEPDIHVSFHDTAPIFVAAFGFLKLKNQDAHNNLMRLYFVRRDQLRLPITKMADELKGFRWGSV